MTQGAWARCDVYGCRKKATLDGFCEQHFETDKLPPLKKKPVKKKGQQPVQLEALDAMIRRIILEELYFLQK